MAASKIAAPMVEFIIFNTKSIMFNTKFTNSWLLATLLGPRSLPSISGFSFTCK